MLNNAALFTKFPHLINLSDYAEFLCDTIVYIIFYMKLHELCDMRSSQLWSLKVKVEVSSNRGDGEE